ncbi:hypothetical protein HanPI659440_Chr15g0610391 [Helianthus annuus]|nr:hypothetical protein HanPI659440_Chr15g0610391 [Helianthus annuus]
MACVVSKSLYFKPLCLPIFSPLLNSSICVIYNSRLIPSNVISLLLNGIFLTQSPPLFHSPPSKCIGANVRKIVIPLKFSRLLIALNAVLIAFL